MFRVCSVAALVILLGASGTASADEVHRLSLRDAVAHGLEKHPAIGSDATRLVVAGKKVDVAKADAAPRVTVVGQVNRSTGNVVPGATFGMTGIPGVQGPPGATRFGAGTWQSVAGVSAGWDVVELERRSTIVKAAESEVVAVKVRGDVTRLSVATSVADAYFVAAQSRAVLVAAQAAEDRAKTFEGVVTTLVGQKLRPELDGARAESELATARVATERARLGVTVASLKLAEVIGEAGWTVEVEADFAELPPEGGAPTTSATHPAVASYDAHARAAVARSDTARLARLPKVEVLASAWLRGGGYDLGGPNSAIAGGLLPDTPNWAVGVVATWSPLDFLTANARASVEAAEADVQRSYGREASENLSAASKMARATFASTLAVAKQTAIAVASAGRARALALSRYQEKLATIVDVADAERALAAAGRDEAVARLEAWRAMVALCRAQGDLGPLLALTPKAKG